MPRQFQIYKCKLFRQYNSDTHYFHQRLDYPIEIPPIFYMTAEQLSSTY